jgi:hypothetical protein
MARVFVFSDNMAARVEVIATDGVCYAYCIGCVTGRDSRADDLLEDTHEGYVFEDAVEVASIHADRCTRCADPDCRTEGRHDAGHRCRKD